MESHHSYDRTSILTQCSPKDVPVELPGPSRFRALSSHTALFCGSHQAISITDILDLFKVFLKIGIHQLPSAYSLHQYLPAAVCISSCFHHQMGLGKQDLDSTMEPINSFYDSVDVRIPGLLNIATKWSHRVRASRAIGIRKALVQVLGQYLGRRREKSSSLISWHNIKCDQLSVSHCYV